MTTRSSRRTSTLPTFLTVVVVVWLVIGAIAAGQRHYYSGKDKPSCAKVSTIGVTMVAGPLNYIGANPKIKCHTPEPSK